MATAAGKDKVLFDFDTARFATEVRGKNEESKPRHDFQKQPPGRGQIGGTLRFAEISSFLEKWKAAWENKNLNALMGFYDPRYKVGPVDYRMLRERKRAALNKYETIEIGLQDIQIKGEDGMVRVDFVQSFRGDDYSDKGHKSLRLAPDSNGILRIISDHWTPLAIRGPDRRITAPESVTAIPQRPPKMSGQDGSPSTGKPTPEERISAQDGSSLATDISAECESSIHKSKNCSELRMTLLKLLRKLRPLRRKQLRQLYLSETEKSFLKEAEFDERCIVQHLEMRCSPKKLR